MRKRRRHKPTRDAIAVQVIGGPGFLDAAMPDMSNIAGVIKAAVDEAVQGFNGLAKSITLMGEVTPSPAPPTPWKGAMFITADQQRLIAAGQDPIDFTLPPDADLIQRSNRQYDIAHDVMIQTSEWVCLSDGTKLTIEETAGGPDPARRLMVEMVWFKPKYENVAALGDIVPTRVHVGTEIVTDVMRPRQTGDPWWSKFQAVGTTKTPAAPIDRRGRQIDLEDGD